MSKARASIISMSPDKNSAEIVTITERADGKFHSVTRHIHKENDRWAGISSSDEVVRNHAAASKNCGAAQNDLNEAQRNLRNAEKEHLKAAAIGRKDPPARVRAKVNAAALALERAKMAFSEATETVKQAAAAKEALEKETLIMVGYSIAI